MAKEPSPSVPPPKKGENGGWIDGLAQRSTGLPGKCESPVPQEKSPWALAGVGLQFAVTTAIFAFVGVYLDGRFGWTPWATIGMSVVGFVGGLYVLIKRFLGSQ